MKSSDLDINTKEGLIEFHERVVSKCSWAKKKPSGIWIDDNRYQKDHYHYWRSKRALEKINKPEVPDANS